MPDSTIEEIFEVGPIKQTLLVEQSKLQAALAKMSETEKAILSAGAKFSSLVF
jgi:hypothetical protein